MNKITIRLATLCIIGAHGFIGATTQFRTPVSLKRGFIHLYLPHVQRTCWYQGLYHGCYEDRDSCTHECLWNDHEWHNKFVTDNLLDSYEESPAVQSQQSNNLYQTYQGAVNSWRESYRKAKYPLFSKVEYNKPTVDEQSARDRYLNGARATYEEYLRPWYIYQWGGSYYRTANKAFFNPCDPCKNTFHTTGLSELFFGQSSFTVEQSFAGSIILNPLLPGFTPFLSFSAITPHFNYTEKGAVFGITAERRFGCDQEWRAGFRGSLPFKIITVTQGSNCGGQTVEEGLSDVIAQRPFNVDAAAPPNAIDYAYRLDFLSTLVRPAIPFSNSQLLVMYGTPTQVTTIAVPVGNNVNAQNVTPPDVYLIKSPSGVVPPLTTLPNSTDQSYAKFFQQATGPLAVDGSGIVGDTYFFGGTPTNYAGSLQLNRPAQSTLWVVPRVEYTLGDSPAGTPMQLTPQAIAIYSAIQAIIGTFQFASQETAILFLSNRCIDLCKDEYIAGLGDMETEFYVGHGLDYWYANFITGIRWPTGKKQDDARRVYYQTTGHNGHYEIKLGLEGGWKVCDFFGFKLDGFYNHAFSRVEKKAAPFVGASTRNIGPNVDAKVSWDYFVMHADLDFFHPCNGDLGFVIGYELFAKLKDKVRLCQTTAVDLLGVTQPLDPTILEHNTNAMTHKIRGEIFHRWNFCELFVDASHVIAGKNAMQESEVSLGVAIYF